MIQKGFGACLEQRDEAFFSHRDIPACQMAPGQSLLRQQTGRKIFFQDCIAPLIGLPSDVSRSGQDVKTAYREVVEKLISVFEADLDGPEIRERALLLVTLCVGGIVLARGIGDTALAEDIRGVAYRHAQRAAGWLRSTEGKGRIRNRRAAAAS
jgi:hypothetical protein